MYAIVRDFQLLFTRLNIALTWPIVNNLTKKDRNKLQSPVNAIVYVQKSTPLCISIELKDIPPIPRGEMSHKYPNRKI